MGLKVVVHFSGGIDSSGALLWALKVFGPDKVYAMFMELDAAIPYIDQHVRYAADKYGFRVMFMQPARGSLVQAFYDRPLPGFAFPWCKQFLTKELNAYLKKKFLPSETLLVLGGTSKEKSPNLPNSDGTMRRPVRHFYDRMDGIDKFPTIAPQFDSTKAETIKFLLENEFPLWPGYSVGFVRTACWICPMMSQKQSAALYYNFPDLYEKMRLFEEAKGPLRQTGKGTRYSLHDFTMREVNRLKRVLPWKEEKEKYHALDRLMKTNDPWKESTEALKRLYHLEKKGHLDG